MCVRECSAQATRAQSRPTSLCRRDCHHHAAVTRRSRAVHRASPVDGRPSSLHPCLLVMLHGDSDTTRRQGASCASHRHLHRRRLECARLPFLVAVSMLQSCSEQRWPVSHNACASTKVIFGWLRQCGSSRYSQSFKSSMRDESDSHASASIKSARVAKPVRTRNSSHNLCFQVPSTARRSETTRDSLVAAFAVLEFRFLANVLISFLPDAFNVPRRMQRLIVAESSYVS